MIKFRKKHPVVRGRMPASQIGFPAYSAHNLTPWNDKFDDQTREVGILFTGYYEKKKTDDIVFLCMNMHWETRDFILPTIPGKHEWELDISTAEENKFNKIKEMVTMIGRSVAILTVKRL